MKLRVLNILNYIEIHFGRIIITMTAHKEKYEAIESFIMFMHVTVQNVCIQNIGHIHYFVHTTSILHYAAY